MGRLKSKKRKNYNQDNSMHDSSSNMAANTSGTQSKMDTFVIKEGDTVVSNSSINDTSINYMLTVLKTMQSMQQNQDLHFSNQNNSLRDILEEQKKSIEELKTSVEYQGKEIETLKSENKA